MHDFLIPELGRANPYGVYDLASNSGWVSVGIDHDTAAFAVETIRRWWFGMGKAVYHQAQHQRQAHQFEPGSDRPRTTGSRNCDWL